MNNQFIGATLTFTLCLLFLIVSMLLNKKRKEHYLRDNTLILLVTPIAGVSLLLMAYFHSPNVYVTNWGDPEQFGQFGDMVGGIINPIFGFITILLLIRESSERRRAHTEILRYEKANANVHRMEQELVNLKEEIETLLSNKLIKDIGDDMRYSFKDIRYFNQGIGSLLGGAPYIRWYMLSGYIKKIRNRADEEEINFDLKKSEITDNDFYEVLQKNQKQVQKTATELILKARLLLKASVEIIELHDTITLTSAALRSFRKNCEECLNYDLVDETFIRELNAKALKIIMSTGIIR